MEKGSSAGASSSDGGINGFLIGVMVIAVLLAAVILLSVLQMKRSSPVSSHYYMDESGQNRQFAFISTRARLLILPPVVFAGTSTFWLGIIRVLVFPFAGRPSTVDMKPLEKSMSIDSVTLPSVPYKTMNDNKFENKLNNSRRISEPINLVTYSSSELQAATGNWHSSRLIGQGTVGRVYKAKYANGQVGPHDYPPNSEKNKLSHNIISRSQHCLELIVSSTRWCQICI